MVMLLLRIFYRMYMSLICLPFEQLRRRGHVLKVVVSTRKLSAFKP